jgi:hypothetical protein
VLAEVTEDRLQHTVDGAVHNPEINPEQKNRDDDNASRSLDFFYGRCKSLSSYAANS